MAKGIHTELTFESAIEISLLESGGYTKGLSEDFDAQLGLFPKYIIKPIWGIEIKWSNRYVEKTNELNSIMQFCEKNKLSCALVATINLEGNKTFKELEFTFIPAALYAYNVGVNTLKMKGNNEE